MPNPHHIISDKLEGKATFIGPENVEEHVTPSPAPHDARSNPKNTHDPELGYCQAELVIRPMLPNKPPGVPRVNDRRGPQRHLLGTAVGAPWCNLPQGYGLNSKTTHYK